MKESKGVTLITLAVTIFVLLTLAGVAINVGYGTYQDMLVTGYVAKMNMVQARVNVISERVEQGDTSFDTVGMEISELNDNQKDRVNSILGGASGEGFRYYDEEALAELRSREDR